MMMNKRVHVFTNTEDIEEEEEEEETFICNRPCILAFYLVHVVYPKLGSICN